MLVIVVVVAVGGFVAFGLYLYLSQDRMVFFPTHELEGSPGDLGLDFQELMIEVADGERVHAWFVPAPRDNPSGDDSAENDRPTVIFCHGNGGNISHRLATIEVIHRLGGDLLLFDYRGYGQSDGSPSEANLYADAEACYRWLIDEIGVQPDRIVWFGRSLGGAVAVDLAARVDCAGLIVESSFTSAKEMGRRMFPWFPIGLLLRYQFDSVEKIGRVGCPVLVMHSQEDDMIPYSMGRQLFERAAEPKEFVTLVGDHNERGYFGHEEYLSSLRSILWPGGEQD
jgi:fermentation-respiration switch protein FrsA (DUF1100 family)